MLQHITIVTPTGARPDAFAICVELMRRQTFAGSVRWLIVDDGPEAEPAPQNMPDNWRVERARPTPLWSPVQDRNTQGRNLRSALPAILDGPETDLIVFVEDDDYYAPEWLDRLAAVAAERDEELIGEGPARYYNLAGRRYRHFSNRQHTSLRCTALRGSAIYSLAEVLDRPTDYYDIALWDRHVSRFLFEGRMTVGIKGLPGRPGIAPAHNPQFGCADPFLDEFHRMLGEDVHLYEGFLGDPVVPEMRQMQVTEKGARKLTFAPLSSGDLFSPPNVRDGRVYALCGFAEYV